MRSEDVIDRYVDDVVARIGPLSRPHQRRRTTAATAPARSSRRSCFARSGVDARGLFCESDGTFPNHHPDPDGPREPRGPHRRRAARAAPSSASRSTATPIASAWSTATGGIIWGDHLLILYARDVLARTGQGQPIIFDVKCSQALPDAIETAGGTPVMWKTGHSLIKDKMKETRAPLAGEMSGHMFFAEGFYGHDDALYGAARLLRIVADSGQHGAASCSPTFRSSSRTPEIRVDCADERQVRDRRARGRSTSAAMHDVIDVDGVRVLFGDGWGLIRASNTQPVLVTRFEARSQERLAAIRGEMEAGCAQQGVTV